jgi:hypothetical protein
MFVILVRIYLRPYQEATGALAASGGIKRLSGELLLVPGGPLVVVPTMVTDLNGRLVTIRQQN